MSSQDVVQLEIEDVTDPLETEGEANGRWNSVPPIVCGSDARHRSLRAHQRGAGMIGASSGSGFQPSSRRTVAR
jgi:hypothetical protein